MHRRRELESLEMHRRIAGRLVVDPAAVLEKARANLARWLAGREDDALARVYREWERLLDELSTDQLARLLVAESEDAARLRQSSPFAGVLSAREVWEIKRGVRDAAA